MSLKIPSITVDLAKEQEGDWVDVAEWPGVRLKVRSINSKDYQNAREQQQTKLTRNFGRLPYASEMTPHVNRFAATFLLLGWEGIVDGDEKPIEYSPEKAMEMLTDPSMRTLVEQVIWAANRVGSKDAEFTAAAVKN